MRKNIFEYLRKKILKHSIIVDNLVDTTFTYEIECLGFQSSIIFYEKPPSKKIIEGMLIDKLVEKSEFLMKLQQVENRESNLKSLLD